MTLDTAPASTIFASANAKQDIAVLKFPGWQLLASLGQKTDSWETASLADRPSTINQGENGPRHCRLPHEARYVTYPVLLSTCLHVRSCKSHGVISDSLTRCATGGHCFSGTLVLRSEGRAGPACPVQAPKPKRDITMKCSSSIDHSESVSTSGTLPYASERRPVTGRVLERGSLEGTVSRP